MSDSVRAIEVHPPIERVTVLEDRALIKRAFKIESAAGRARVTLPKISPVTADRTVTVRAVGEGVTVDDVRVRREMREEREGSPEETRRLEEEIEEGQFVQRELAEKINACQKKSATLDEIRQKAYAEMAEDAAWNRIEKETWEASLERIRTLASEVEETKAALQREVELKAEEVKRKALRLSRSETRSKKLKTWLEIDLSGAEGSSGEWSLEVSYIVPGACFRPLHTARMRDGRVHFECDAMVWQNTGEDWNEVEVVLSTERASLGSSPPLLDSDVLAVTKKRETLAVQWRDQKVEEASDERAAAFGDAPLPGIDDGGETQELTAVGRHSIVSDGRPNRLPLFSFDSEMELELVCTPELDATVYEKVSLTNGAPRPLLAGPVDLEKRGGACGKTRILFVAPGEKFKISFGPDPSLRAMRSKKLLPDQSTLLGGYTTKTDDVVIALSNLGGDPKTLVVRERVPVSELEKVVITVIDKETTGGKLPDDNGFIEWEVTLAPHGTKRLKCRCAIKRHSDVVDV